MFRKILAVVFCLLPAALPAAPPPGIVRLSDAGDPDFFNGFGDRESLACRLSGDGRHAVFVSQARNLTEASPGAAYASVYVRDRTAGTTQRLALDPEAFVVDPQNTADISGNGRRVVSVARSMATFEDAILLQDVVDGTTLVIAEPGAPPSPRPSKGSSGGEGGARPRISTDGSVVVFASNAGLLPGVDAGLSHIYRYEVAGGTLTLASADEHGTPGNGDSYLPSVSADGGRVAFVTDADNLLTDLSGNPVADANSVRDAVIRTHATGRVRLASLDDGGAALTYPTQVAEISGNGLALAFTSMDPALQPDAAGLRVFVRQFDTGNTVPVSIDAGGDPIEHATVALAIDHTGRRVAFVYSGPDPDYDDFVLSYHVRDLVSATTVTLGPGTRRVFNLVQVALSPDGSDACFDAFSDAVLPDDSNGSSDVFVFPTGGGSAELVSAGAVPVTWAGGHNARISADGSTVVFESTALNIVAGLPASRLDQSNLVHVDVASGARAAILPQLDGTPLERSYSEVALAADGHHIAFVNADSRVNADGAALRFDLRDGSWTTLGMNPGDAPIGRASEPSLSADGGTIVFRSDDVAFPGVPAGTSQVVSWREGEAATLLSQSALGVPAAMGAYTPLPDRSGDCVAFTAYDSGLTDTALPGTQLFLRDAGGVLRDVNSVAGTEVADYVLSGDCSRLAFSLYVSGTHKTAKGGGAPAGLWLYDIAQGELRQIELPVDGLELAELIAIEASGRYLAISTQLPEHRRHLWRLDLQANVMYRISPTEGLEEINGVAFADGGQRLVAVIGSDDFGPDDGDRNGDDDVYLIELPGDAIFMDDFGD